MNCWRWRAQCYSLLAYSTVSLFLLFQAACVLQGGDEVFRDVPNLTPKEAVIVACDTEGPPSFPVEDVKVGRGRVAQNGRKMTVRVTASGEGGRVGQTAEVAFVYPPLDRDRWGYAVMNLSTGEVPEYFFTTIAGMRVGGVRRVRLPRVTTLPDAELRRFVDAKTGATLEIPSKLDVPLEVELLSVCKPRFYFQHSSGGKRVVQLGCW